MENPLRSKSLIQVIRDPGWGPIFGAREEIERKREEEDAGLSLGTTFWDKISKLLVPLEETGASGNPVVHVAQR